MKKLSCAETEELRRLLWSCFELGGTEVPQLMDMVEENPKMGRTLLAVAQLGDNASVTALAKSLLNAAHVR